MSEKRLVYGIVGGHNLVLLPEEVAEAVAEDLAAIAGVRTYGDASRLQLRVLSLPGLDDEQFYDGEVAALDEDEVADLRLEGMHFEDDPYDAWAISECQDGEWSPRAATLALDHLPEDLDDIGEQIEHFPMSPILQIEPSVEERLVELLRARGYVVRRDDALIARIDPYA
jgi:hypothetical protein